MRFVVVTCVLSAAYSRSHDICPVVRARGARSLTRLLAYLLRRERVSVPCAGSTRKEEQTMKISEGAEVMLLHCTDEHTTLRTGDLGRCVSDNGNVIRVRFKSGAVETLVRSAGDHVIAVGSVRDA